MNLQLKLDEFINSYFDKNLEFIDASIYTSLRESETIEFKNSLHRSSNSISKDYLKTICGFANNNGGVIVFGIDPDNFKLVGIKQELKDFDNRFISTTINNGFDGNVEAIFKTKSYSSTLIGFLFVEKAKIRPVILKQFVDNGATEGDIIYRYSGQTKKIHSTDLRRIIDEEIKHFTDHFLERINQIATIGIENSAILNTLSGEITTEQSNVKLILEPELLKSLHLIPEANIVQKDGIPGYIIKGHIYPENTTYIEKEVRTSISPQDLYDSFFKGSCTSPREYIKTILYHQSSSYPIYFFINQSDVSIDVIVSDLENLNSPDIKKQTKKTLIEKLRKDVIEPPIASRLPDLVFDSFDLKQLKSEISKIRLNNEIKGNRDKAIIREVLYRHLLSKAEVTKSALQPNFKEFVEAISHLPEEFVIENKTYIFDIVERILKLIGVQEEGALNAKSEFKKMVCRLDYILYH